MTDQPPPQPYDPSRVMLNGAAIGLVTSLTDGMQTRLIDEIKAAEERQNTKLDRAVAALSGDVDALEAWRQSVEDARLVRTGQMSVFRAAGSMILRYDRVILSLTIAGAVAAAALMGFHIQVGP